MTKDLTIGMGEALELTLDGIRPLEFEMVQLIEGVDRVVSDDLSALADSPSIDASMKDGYAVLSREVAGATPEKPVRLRLMGYAAAGMDRTIPVCPGETVRVLTGARIPSGADAVVSEEFAVSCGEEIEFLNFAEPGRNILFRGSDVTEGSRLISRGTILTPGMAGLLAAAGHHRIPVFRQPRVFLVATGDEVVAPGKPLQEGKLYASNLTTLGAWCRRYLMQIETAIVQDEPTEMADIFKKAVAKADAIVTSGGAWTGDRDMVADILSEMGWEQVFHRIRIGPGKAVGFGLLAGKPVFVLPGGPPSNLTGFLQIALPGLLKLAGHSRPALPQGAVKLAIELVGSHSDWTQFYFGRLERTNNDLPLFYPLNKTSRLHSMAEADAMVSIPEGRIRLPAGSTVQAQMLV